MPAQFFRFEHFELVPRRRWVRARYRATLDDIAKRHDCFRLLGAPEIRGDSSPDALTAGHLARSPDGRR